jgi:hypothetical protein
LIVGVNFMSRFGNAPIEQHKARVTELLSYGATRAEPAKFQEEI